MPWVSVKCTSCGGDIQLDDQRESGFCVFCGSKIVYKEAVQRMEISGQVSIDGIAGLERLVQNAEKLHALGDYQNERETLNQIIQSYPEDYRGYYYTIFLFFERFKVKCEQIAKQMGRPYSDKQYDEIFLASFDPVLSISVSLWFSGEVKNVDYFLDLISRTLQTVPENKFAEIKQQLSFLLFPYMKRLLEEEKRYSGILTNHSASNDNWLSAKETLDKANQAYNSAWATWNAARQSFWGARGKRPELREFVEAESKKTKIDIDTINNYFVDFNSSMPVVDEYGWSCEGHDDGQRLYDLQEGNYRKREAERKYEELNQKVLKVSSLIS